MGNEWKLLLWRERRQHVSLRLRFVLVFLASFSRLVFILCLDKENAHNLLILPRWLSGCETLACQTSQPSEKPPLRASRGLFLCTCSWDCKFSVRTERLIVSVLICWVQAFSLLSSFLRLSFVLPHVPHLSDLSCPPAHTSQIQ